MLRGISGRRHELIPHSPDSLDLRVRIAELVAQLLHVNVDRACLAGIRESPNVLEEAVAREDDPGLPAEGFEKLELLRSERDDAFADMHFVPRRIDAHVPDDDCAAA